MDKIYYAIWRHYYKISRIHWNQDKMAAILQTISNAFSSDSEDIWISIKISLKFLRKGPIDNESELVQVMLGTKQVTNQTIWTNAGLVCRHIWVTGPRWANLNRS